VTALSIQCHMATSAPIMAHSSNFWLRSLLYFLNFHFRGRIMRRLMKMEAGSLLRHKVCQLGLKFYSTLSLVLKSIIGEKYHRIIFLCFFRVHFLSASWVDYIMQIQNTKSSLKRKTYPSFSFCQHFKCNDIFFLDVISKKKVIFALSSDKWSSY